MPISLIRINNFRNLSQVELEPGWQGINLVSGDNGSGKSSLLEAIYYLGHNRSFRTSSATKMIQHQQPKFSIYSQIIKNNEMAMPVGIERYDNGSSKLKVGKRDVASIAELSKLLPIRVINSQSHSIFESGPSHRRKYLDWGLFYYSDQFLIIWRQYERILKQRNMALKANCPKSELEIWTKKLAEQGSALSDLRMQYIEALTPHIKSHVNALLGAKTVTLNYYKGWEGVSTLEETLNRHYFDEKRLGVTYCGPHRADFDVFIDDVSAQYFLSRGQQKLLICGMILAQGNLLLQQHNKALIYLVDDLPSELDNDSRDKLIHLLTKQKTQIFISSIESEPVCDVINRSSTSPINVFHVEHGTVTMRTNR